MAKNVTNEVKRLIDAGQAVDLSYYGDEITLSHIPLRETRQCRIRFSKPTTVYIDADIDPLYGVFDLEQNSESTRRYGLFSLTGPFRREKPTIVGAGDRHFFHQRVYDHEQNEVHGMFQQYTARVNFREFRHGAGVKVMKVRTSTVADCHAEDFTGSGTLHHFIDTANDSPQSIVTVDCTFDNVTAPTAQAIPVPLFNLRKKTPPQITIQNLRGRRITGEWKTHGPNSIEMSNCQMEAAPGTNASGFKIPPDIWQHGFYAKNCHFEGYHAGLLVDAGEIYDRTSVIVENLSVDRCSWAIAGSNQQKTFVFGTLTRRDTPRLCNVPLYGDFDDIEYQTGLATNGV